MKAVVLLLLPSIVILHAVLCSAGESSTCLTVYKEGGAPAVFKSPKCPRWILPNYDSRPRPTPSCETATLQGRRNSLEDRTLCLFDLTIPFPGERGLKEVSAGIAAVFDGHNGAEASEMASKLLLEYFGLHTFFLLDASYASLFRESIPTLPNKGHKDFVFQLLNFNKQLKYHDLHFQRFQFSIPTTFDDSFHLEVLKEALLRAIHDIDATFSKEASRQNFVSGSTAAIALIADGQILVANIGDSKVLLCSKEYQSPTKAKGTLLRLYLEQRREGASAKRNTRKFRSAASNGMTYFTVEELTKDHHLDREDEKFRVENAGGYVTEWGGVPRVNGQLVVSRSIGDVHFKRYGVISAPEVTDWKPLTINDSYLVVASDGMFERLSLQGVCDILWEMHSPDAERSLLSSLCSHSKAECLVKTAFEKGSTDNVAAVVVPLQSVRMSLKLPMERCTQEQGFYCQTDGTKILLHKQLDLEAAGFSSSVVRMEHGHSLVSLFDRLLVEEKRQRFGCYYLFENLDNDDGTIGVQKIDKADNVYDLSQALPEPLVNQPGRPLNLYNDWELCMQFEMTVGGAKDQCLNPDGFASFLGLLESIPFHETSSTSGSNEYAIPDSSKGNRWKSFTVGSVLFDLCFGGLLCCLESFIEYPIKIIISRFHLRYVLKKRFGRGSYGEVWLAFHWNCHGDGNLSSWSRMDESVSSDSSSFTSNMENSSHRTDDCNSGDNFFILKRIMVERGPFVYLSGLREKYFGEVFLNASRRIGGLLSDKPLVGKLQIGFDKLLGKNESFYGSRNNWTFEEFNKSRKPSRAPFKDGLNHIVRYIESFESRSNEIWLVFRHEGISLSKILYTVEADNNHGKGGEEAQHVQILRPSKWWHWLKTTKAGNEEMQNIIFQLLMALKACHDRNITHRDIKPENVMICFEDWDTGTCLKELPTGDMNYTTKVRIIDFGSAMDEFTMKHLYGSTGPSRAEQTFEYAPPESLLNASWHQGESVNLKYDLWSVGVVILELILGSPNVFQISARTRALLEPHIEGWNDELKELAYKLRSLMELCILVTGSSSKHHTRDQAGVSPASWKCSEEFFSQQIKSRDSLKLGFPNVWALRLVRQLLVWKPEDRLGVDDALQHPYFQPTET